MKKYYFYIFLVIMIVGIIGVISLSPFAIINAGHRGVQVTFGQTSNIILGEGFHIVSPLVEIVELDVRKQKLETQADAASKDLQSVQATIALNYNLDPKNVNKLYRDIGRDFEDRIIAPAIQEAVKASTAKYTAEELVTKRENVRDAISKALSSRLNRSYILVSDVSIVNFGFSKEFNQAIEAKQTAQQEALRAKNELEKVKTEAEQRVAQAQAEAEAIRLQSSAANNDNYVKLKALEVQELAIKKWDGQLPTNFVPESTLPFLNLTQ